MGKNDHFCAIQNVLSGTKKFMHNKNYFKHKYFVELCRLNIFGFIVVLKSRLVQNVICKAGIKPKLLLGCYVCVALRDNATLIPVTYENLFWMKQQFNRKSKMEWHDNYHCRPHPSFP